MARPDRPASWKDLLRQFVGGIDAERPVYVAPVSDLRGLSSREPAPYQSFSVAAGNPGAGNHWCYTLTPLNPSKSYTARVCWARAQLETATALLGVRIGIATAKAATNAIFPIGDPTLTMGGAWTVDEITNANLPLTLYNVFGAEDLEFFESFPYPEYWIEFVIPQGQVAEIISLTQDDAFSLRMGWYAQPIL